MYKTHLLEIQTVYKQIEKKILLELDKNRKKKGKRWSVEYCGYLGVRSFQMVTNMASMITFVINNCINGQSGKFCNLKEFF